MKVTVIGSGNMGSSFVKQFSAAGHQVVVTGRDFEKASKLAEQYANVHAASPGEAAIGADVIVLATAYGDAVSALLSLGDSVANKVVIDITNPLTADYMGLTLGHSTSAAEELQKAVPSAKVVKAFNTVFAQVLGGGAKFANNETVPVFYAGDDEGAKLAVKTLIDSVGFKPVDAGGLKNARYLEPLAGLNIYFGYGAGLGTSIAPTWIQRGE